MTYRSDFSGERPVVFVDLDDTMFTSRRKIATGDPLPVAYDRTGQASSFMSTQQRALFDWLAGTCLVVPTTGRNFDAYRRVDLPFGGPAILSHGGLIVDRDGHPDPGYLALVTSAASDCQDLLQTLVAEIRALALAERVDVRARAIRDGGIDLYCSVKHNQEDARALAAFAPAMTGLMPAGWTVHLNDNNFAVMPPFVSKAAAVRYFLETLAAAPPFVLALGDSLSDLGFLALADFAALPTGSQAFRHLLGTANGL